MWTVSFVAQMEAGEWAPRGRKLAGLECPLGLRGATGNINAGRAPEELLAQMPFNNSETVKFPGLTFVKYAHLPKTYR